MEWLNAAMAQALANAFKALLSEKHLYQYVEVDLDILSKKVKEIERERALAESEPRARYRTEYRQGDDLVSQKQKVVDSLWVPRPIEAGDHAFLVDSTPTVFELPTINTFCNRCKGRWPFNPNQEGSYLERISK